jgi:hypothetical protein
MQGVERLDARQRVREKMHHILAGWKGG